MNRRGFIKAMLAGAAGVAMAPARLFGAKKFATGGIVSRPPFVNLNGNDFSRIEFQIPPYSPPKIVHADFDRFFREMLKSLGPPKQFLGIEADRNAANAKS